jgi:hypothetical protein
MPSSVIPMILDLRLERRFDRAGKQAVSAHQKHNDRADRQDYA